MEDSEGVAPRRWSRRRRIGLGLATLIVLMLAVLWGERRPVATHFIDRELARRGVPARYTISDLGLGRQRLTDVVIGDPRAPDLTADWVETRSSVGFTGISLTGIRAGHVRLRGRVADGRVALGAIDRLLPPPSGKPFALPGIDLDLADARVSLATPIGPFVLRLAGKGRLNDGWRGRMQAVSGLVEGGRGILLGPCRMDGLSADVALTIDRGAPRLVGPLRSAGGDCAGVALASPRLALDMTLAPALDRWRGAVGVTSAVDDPARQMHAQLGGRLAFAGDARETRGRLAISGPADWFGHGHADRIALSGDVQLGSVNAFSGRLGIAAATIAPRLLARATTWRAAGSGTPVAPLVRQAAQAVVRAGQRWRGEATILAQRAGDVTTLGIERLDVSAASGARLTLAGGRGVGWRSVDGGWRADTRVALAGGGLPTLQVALAKPRTASPLTATASVAPYAAHGAEIAFAPIQVRATGDGDARLITHATLSGPLGDGRIDGLDLPLDVRVAGGWAINPGCTAASFRRLTLSGLTLDPARLRLCASGPALVTLTDGRIGGGGRLAALSMEGRIGSSPLSLSTAGARVGLANRDFAASTVEARIGDPARPTRIALGSLSGRVGGDGLSGSFAGGEGRIGAVPLVMSDADGDWRLAAGALRLDGRLTVADAETMTPRFKPLNVQAVHLTLVDGTVRATGRLAEPTTGTRVADVTLVHAFGPGRGSADLIVRALTFADAFQPDLLTPLTFGVIADVRGSVAGEGHIAWNADGVTSTGTFGTNGIDLAAAFGPVTGIATEIRFTDLLALESAPDQVATIKSINPGVAVTDGTIRYRLLPETRVRVDSGRWPFAGGTLALEPTLLDFAAPATRRLTFRVDGVAADQFLQQFDFKNIDATGTFDGVLPMVFDASGGRIEDGRLAVRPGGGTIAYVGDLTEKDLGFWGNLAFQALKSLRYRSLGITMNGPLSGEMVTEVRFAGVSQGQGAKSNFLIRRLQRLPFVFNIRIRAPFRGLIDSAQSFYDPRRLIQRNLPALIEQQNKAAAAPGATAIQPPASEAVP